MRNFGRVMARLEVVSTQATLAGHGHPSSISWGNADGGGGEEFVGLSVLVSHPALG